MLIKAMHALHHLKDSLRPGMWELVVHDCVLMLCTQRQGQSKTKYLQVFHQVVNIINKVSGMVGITTHSIKLVCQKEAHVG